MKPSIAHSYQLPPVKSILIDCDLTSEGFDLEWKWYLILTLKGVQSKRRLQLEPAKQKLGTITNLICAVNKNLQYAQLPITKLAEATWLRLLPTIFYRMQLHFIGFKAAEIRGTKNKYTVLTKL